MDTLLDLLAFDYTEWYIYLYDHDKFWSVQFNEWNKYNRKLDQVYKRLYG